MPTWKDTLVVRFFCVLIKWSTVIHCVLFCFFFQLCSVVCILYYRLLKMKTSLLANSGFIFSQRRLVFYKTALSPQMITRNIKLSGSFAFQTHNTTVIMVAGWQTMEPKTRIQETWEPSSLLCSRHSSEAAEECGAGPALKMSEEDSPSRDQQGRRRRRRAKRRENSWEVGKKQN